MYCGYYLQHEYTSRSVRQYTLPRIAVRKRDPTPYAVRVLVGEEHLSV